MDLLGIVSTKNFEDIDEGYDIRVINNDKCPFIEYRKKGDSSNWEVFTISEIGVPLAKASDLEYLLRKRNWNTPERKFIDCKGNLCLLKDDGSLDYIPTINVDKEIENKYYLEGNPNDPKYGTILNSMPIHTQELYNYVDDDGTYILPVDLVRKIVSDIRKKESESRSKNNITDDTFYDIIQECSEKISGGCIDIISQGSSIYTNIVNLNHYLDISQDIIEVEKNVIVKLGIDYVKKENAQMNRYSTVISFIPFDFTIINGVKKIISNNFTREINEDVVVEYINGCVRVFSLDTINITECIISFCNLNYEQ